MSGNADDRESPFQIWEICLNRESQRDWLACLEIQDQRNTELCDAGAMLCKRRAQRTCSQWMRRWRNVERDE